VATLLRVFNLTWNSE